MSWSESYGSDGFFCSWSVTYGLSLKCIHIYIHKNVFSKNEPLAC